MRTVVTASRSTARLVPAAAPPLAAYGKLPAVESVEISPDGRRLAFQTHPLADHSPLR